MRQTGLDQEHRPPDVHGERLVEPGQGDPAQRFRQGIGCVVDDDVNAAEGLDGGSDQALGVLGLAEVRRNRQRLATGATDGGGHLLTGIGLATGDHHPGALGGKALGHGTADPPAATGHDGDPTGQVVQGGDLRSVHVRALRQGGPVRDQASPSPRCPTK